MEVKYKGPKDMITLMNIAIFRLKNHIAVQAIKTHLLYLPFLFLFSLLNSVRGVYLYGLCSIPVSQEHVFYTCPQVESERRDWESHILYSKPLLFCCLYSWVNFLRKAKGKTAL